MDSITHLAAGACIGGLIAGKEKGLFTAMTWGAVFSVIPDIDVFIGVFLGEMQTLALHRGITHSLFFSLTAPFLLALLPYKLHSSLPYSKWLLIAFLAQLSHILLDYVTSYGIQLLAPFSEQLFYGAMVSIIDPLFSLPMLLAVGLIIPIRFRAHSKWILACGLILSSIYLSFCILNKQRIDDVFVRNLERESIEYKTLLTKPTLLNNLLWRGIAANEKGYYTGFYSILDDEPVISFQYTPKNAELIASYSDLPGVHRLKWFADGFYNVQQISEGEYRFNNLRFGRAAGWAEDRETRYVYSYALKTDGKKTEIYKVPLSFADKRHRPGLMELLRRVAGDEGRDENVNREGREGL